MFERRSTDMVKISREPVKVAIWVLLILLTLWFAAHIFTTVLIFSLALLLAYLITPLVSWLCSKRVPGIGKTVPWPVSTLAVYLVLTGVLTSILLILFPMVAAQVSALAGAYPWLAKRILAITQLFQSWYQQFHIPLRVEKLGRQMVTQLVGEATPVFSILAKNLAAGLLKTFSVLLILIAAFVFSLYIVLEQKNLRRNFLEMFPKSWREDTHELMKDVGNVVGGFLRATLLMGVVTGVTTYLILFLLGKVGIPYDYALLTGVAAGLLYPIPFFGVWIPRIVVPLLSYLQYGSWSSALWIFVSLSGLGILVDNLVFPVVMSKGIGISPLMILVVVFAGGELFGLWGLVLSLPVSAMIRLLFFYLQKRIAI